MISIPGWSHVAPGPPMRELASLANCQAKEVEVCSRKLKCAAIVPSTPPQSPVVRYKIFLSPSDRRQQLGFK